MKAVILAGGTGSRLWPMSRDLKPKQFHAFTGKKTMLQQTYQRLVDFLKPSDIFVSTNIQYASLAKQQLKNLAADHLILEPEIRDTAPCICFAAHRLAKLGFENEVMAIVYADHLVQKQKGFERALASTAHHIEKIENPDTLSVVAVRAKYPNPHLGYIRIGRMLAELQHGLKVYELERFVEKPTAETAKKFLSSYKYLWNTGLYMWKTKTILKYFRKYTPKIYTATKNPESYSASPKISIDYALMEKIEPKNIRVIPADLGWNDIGNWQALHEQFAERERRNVASGEHVSIDTEGSVILGNSGKLIVTYGIKDMVIVDTDEALLVMSKKKAAEVKHLIDELKKKKKTRFL